MALLKHDTCYGSILVMFFLFNLITSYQENIIPHQHHTTENHVVTGNTWRVAVLTYIYDRTTLHLNCFHFASKSNSHYTENMIYVGRLVISISYFGKLVPDTSHIINLCKHWNIATYYFKHEITIPDWCLC